MAPPPTLLLDHPVAGDTVVADDRLRTNPAPVDGASGQPALPVPSLAPGRPSPVLGGLAALSIFEGYTWTGLIPSGASHLWTTIFSRGGAVVLAGLTVAAAGAVLSSGPGFRRLARTLLATAVTAVVAATLLVEVVTSPTTRSILGATDLTVAAAAATVLVMAEHRARSLSRSVLSATARAVDRAVPGD